MQSSNYSVTEGYLNTKTLNDETFKLKLTELLNANDKDVYSIRIVAEDDGTFDIRIWDERANESCEDIEEGRFKTYQAAETRLEEIISENQEVVFLRIKDDL